MKSDAAGPQHSPLRTSRCNHKIGTGKLTLLGSPERRADIDGLRAIAVLAVIFYHVELPGFSGGYVGVDIFFVISGYVISNLLKKEIIAQDFRLANFYTRRAIRILPALLVVLCVSSVVAWFILMPNDFRNYGRSLFSQTLFVSNIYFWLRSGYFNETAETFPLLHTWSLSVEEQFYFIFPIFYAALLKHWTNYRFVVIALFCICSLTISEELVVGNRDAAFFLFPARAWELLLGALLVEMKPFISKLKETQLEMLGVLGAACVPIAIASYDSNTRFPGLTALLPCLGAGLIILSGEPGKTQMCRLMSANWLVYLGLISYSLYLWHWPILVYLKYVSISSLTFPVLVLAILTTLTVSILSYRYIETPFRSGLIGTKKAITALTVASILIFGFGVLVNVKGGYPNRFPEDIVIEVTDSNQKIPPSRLKPIKISDNLSFSGLASDSPPDIVLWGDSHAGVIEPIMEELSIKHGKNLWHLGCMPVIGVYKPWIDKSVDASPCRKANDEFIALIREKKISTVVMASFWTQFTEDGEQFIEGYGVDRLFYADATTAPRNASEAKRLFAQHFQDTIKTLKSLGVTVFLVNQVPTHRYLVSRQLAKIVRFGGNSDSIKRPLAEHENRMSSLNSLFTSLGDAQFKILDPAPYLCDQQFCYGAEGNVPLYRDSNHLTYSGAKKLQPMLEKIF